ncbi:MAG TPA: hypothetical protein VGP64_04205 [Polyangia bacterium]|jgi:hypothetical protein
MNGCLSEFALDDREIHGRAAPTVEAHVAACPSCRARVAERAARVAEFETELAAPTWTRIAAQRSARRRLPPLGIVLAALGTAVASLLLFVGVVPGRRAASPGPTPKGSAPVEIVCRRGAQTFVIGPGEAVVPGDALRFLPLPIWSEARYIQVGSVDGTGAYAPFYPPADDGLSVALPARGVPLEGSIRLDDAPGPERLLVVLSAAPLATRDVARAAVAHVTAADRIDRIGGVKVVSSWIVLPKRGGGAVSAP